MIAALRHVANWAARRIPIDHAEVGMDGDAWKAARADFRISRIHNRDASKNWEEIC